MECGFRTKLLVKYCANRQTLPPCGFLRCMDVGPTNIPVDRGRVRVPNMKSLFLPVDM